MKTRFFLVLISLFAAMENKASSWSEQTLQKMTPREKIGQFFMVAAASDENQSAYGPALENRFKYSRYCMDRKYVNFLIQNYGVGGVSFSYRSTPQKQIECINEFQKLSSVPLMIGVNAEWGISMRLEQTTQYPHAMTLGALSPEDESLVYDLGEQIGNECRMAGVHMNFAPVVDINNDRKNSVIHDHSFSDDKEKVARLATYFMHGMQKVGILSCAKHFPGLGDMDIKSKKSNVTKEELDDKALYPFKRLIAEGVDAIMVGNVEVPALEKKAGVPASLSYAVVTELLRNKLEFKGLIITDALGTRRIMGDRQPGEVELYAFIAGNDMAFLSTNVPKAIELIEKALHAGTITEQDLNSRVLKILQAKEVMGLHLSRIVDPNNASMIINDLFAPLLRKKLYHQAITLIKNEGQLLPLNTKQWYKCARIENAGVKEVGTTQKEEKLRFFDAVIAKKECVLFEVINMSKKAVANYNISPLFIEGIRRAKEQGKKTVLVLYGTPYAVPLIEFFADVIIVCYEENEETLNALKLVWNDSSLLPKVRGQLPVTINKNYPTGFKVNVNYPSVQYLYDKKNRKKSL